MAWNDTELLSDINYLYHYQKYYLRNGEKNPKINQITQHILNLKHDRDAGGRHPGHPARFDQAVECFSRRLKAALDLLRSDQIPDLAVIVPSSKKGISSSGLQNVLMSACKPHNVRCDCECLVRTKTVEKKASGGCRSMAVHFDSIEVSRGSVMPGERVLLVDDVSTTGNSLRACRELLLNAGAKDVIMLALARTVPEDA